MKKTGNINTYYKLLLLIVATSLFFLLLYASLYLYTIQEEKQFYKSTFNQYKNEVNSLLKLNSETPIATIIDVTFWDALVKYTKTRDENWYEKSVASQFETYNMDYIGVYDSNNNLIKKTNSSKIKTDNFIQKEIMVQLYKSKITRFYLRIPEGIIEVFGATIHPSNDPKKNKSNPSGFFFMVRLLDKQFLENLNQITSSKVSLEEVNHINKAEEDLVSVNVNLKDYKNNSISKLTFKRVFNLNFKNTKEILYIVILASLLNIIICLYFTKRWVYNPLKLITSILETGSLFAIGSLKRTKGEFGYIGNLFEENSNQRKQLEISKHKAEESDKLKSSFLANLSHEIRTPMNAIVGFSDLLNNPDLDENDKSEYLRIINRSGINLVSIIEDLIEMSKIDALQIKPKYKGINLNKCIKELYETIKVTIPKEKQFDFFVIECQNPIKKYLLTDVVKLKQILVNLIANAIKFTDKGSISFGYEIDENDGTVVFTVKDTGRGIDEKNLKAIFDRFLRVEDHFHAESNGLGLGLAISKAYIEMLGGSITVKSSFGNGSIFTFKIPLVFEESERKAKNNTKASYDSNSGNETILIAEDDNINFLLLKKILQLRNYTILRANNGQEAVDICAVNKDIDLVFMDVKMPVMNGLDAFAIIKETNPDLIVIAQTAYSSAEDQEMILNLGFKNYITKPLKREKIFELLDGFFVSKNKNKSITTKDF
ncbi:ATP-binding protein [Flavobacterium urumqiense]|uniref:histidine kinase n=1 Tax=Flavobacterium urumqiense TaxID=935224 RepID=A0A1H5XKG1_9FLAO|nr:ATP-binding protein [Flavobacterium urumqiense]SEG12123.1 Signal transduction histidine kinase [Flavobacterium urumqiense]